MKRLIMTLALSGASILATSGLAAANGTGGNYCGADPAAGGPSNGCAQSMSNTPCAGHGAFGAFGKDNNFAGGASGDRTAFNNSTLCGNPQGAAGTLGQ